MVKKLGGLFLWFCAASVLAQIAILALSYAKGNVQRDTFVKLIATLNGMDIEGNRLQQMITKPSEADTPSREEVIAAKAQESLELDQRERSLNRFKEQLESEQNRLQAAIRDLEARRLAFDEAVAKQKTNVNDQTLGEVQRIIELLTPEQASAQLAKMMQKGAFEDVVAIVKALPDDKRTKILRVFADSDADPFGEMLGKIREGIGLPQLKVDENSK